MHIEERETVSMRSLKEQAEHMQKIDTILWAGYPGPSGLSSVPSGRTSQAAPATPARHSRAKSGATSRRKARAESRKRAANWDEPQKPIEYIQTLFTEQATECRLPTAKSDPGTGDIIPSTKKQTYEPMDCKEQEHTAARPFDPLHFGQEAYSFE